MSPATGRRIRVSDNIRMVLNNETFREVRKAPRLESIFRVRGETWVSRLNSELHDAQLARKQPVEDGYTFYINGTGSRLRLYIVAFTARAQAHERKHSSILKLMETTQYDVELRASIDQKAAAARAKATRRERRRGQPPPERD